MAEHPARVEEEANPDEQLVSRGEFLVMKGQVQEMVAMMRSMTAATMPTLPAAVPQAVHVTPPPPAPVPVQPDLASTSAALPPAGNLPKLTDGPAPTAQVTFPAEDLEQYSNVATAGSMEDRLASQIASMEQSLREIRGIDLYGGTNYSDLCLFPEVQLPPKFKVPDFTKYDGTGCPYTHLRMFCGELGGIGNNEKLRIQLFQRSLKGSALLWYVGEYGRMKTWSELTSLFMGQYKFNTDGGPDRFTIQRMTKKGNESFREYAQRWREIAAQIRPHLEEREMVNYFIQTLPKFYFMPLCASAGRSFSDIIRNGEIIEDGVRTGKIEAPDASSTSNNRRAQQNRPDRGEPSVSAISSGQSSAPRLPSQQSSTSPSAPAAGLTQDQLWLEQKKKRIFTPLGCTLTQAYEILERAGSIRPLPARPTPTPLPRSWDPAAKCEYHSGQNGHATEMCFSLKHKIQDLLDQGQVQLGAPAAPPNVQNNPLPTHGANAITDDSILFNPALLIGQPGEVVVILVHRQDPSFMIGVIEDDAPNTQNPRNPPVQPRPQLLIPAAPHNLLSAPSQIYTHPRPKRIFYPPSIQPMTLPTTQVVVEVPAEILADLCEGEFQ